MQGKSVFKAQKLLKITLDYSGDAIEKVSIRGDFFLYPEESLPKLEAMLKGCRLEEEAIREKAREFMKSSEIFGFDDVSLAQAILQAVKK